MVGADIDWMFLMSNYETDFVFIGVVTPPPDPPCFFFFVDYSLFID